MESGVHRRFRVSRDDVLPTPTPTASDAGVVGSPGTRWKLTLVVSALGLAVGLLLVGTKSVGLWAVALLAPSGAALGLALDLRRALGESRAARIASEQRARILADELRAERELMKLCRRQDDWLRRLDQRADVRLDPVEHALHGTEHVRGAWVLAVRKLGHDLRTPLSVLKSNLGFLRDVPPEELAQEAGPVLDDLELAVDRMTELLDESSRQAKRSAEDVPLGRNTLRVTDLEQRVGSLLDALLRDKAVGWQLTRSADAPSAITSDEGILDRALDVLLSEVVRQVEHGTVDVTFCGGVEALELRISSTSNAEELVPRMASPKELVTRIGGRLEVAASSNGCTSFLELPCEPRGSCAPVEYLSTRRRAG